MRIDRAGARYVLSVRVNPGFEADDEFALAVQELARRVSAEALGGAPVDVRLCDGDFSTLRRVDYAPPTVEHAPRKPAMPIEITSRASVGAGSLVARYRNTSDRFLVANALLQNRTVGDTRPIRLDLRPGGTQEHGWLEGWKYASGETIMITHADYEPLTVTVP